MHGENKRGAVPAFKKEKDPKVHSRMLAVHMVRIRGLGIDETAENLMHSTGQNNPLILTKNTARH